MNRLGAIPRAGRTDSRRRPAELVVSTSARNSPDGLADCTCRAPFLPKLGIHAGRRKVNTLNHHRGLGTVLRLAVAGVRTVRCMTPVVVVTMILLALVGCSESSRQS